MGAHWQKNMNVIAVVGPTASGKSALAIEIAKQFSGEIITVDSRTIYRGMDIGTAKPQGKPQADGSLLSEGIFHWGLDLVNPDEEYSAALFKISAEQKIQEIISRGNLPVLVGGTGLWFDVLLRGLDVPAIGPNAELRKELEQKTTEELRELYGQMDPQGISSIDTKNKRRLIRAIEVTKSGTLFSETRKRKPSPYETLWLGKEWPRAELFARIDERVDLMMKQGFLKEVIFLKEKYGCACPGMSGIGYKELCQSLQEIFSLDQAIQETKKNTRHYAKRQQIWFKRYKDIHWVKTKEEVYKHMQDFLETKQPL